VTGSNLQVSLANDFSLRVRANLIPADIRRVRVRVGILACGQPRERVRADNAGTVAGG
jgi:hypothetical protein